MCFHDSVLDPVLAADHNPSECNHLRLKCLVVGIKADAVYVVKGLCESTKEEWSGDVDLNDGQQQIFYQELQDRLQWIKGIGMKERSSWEAIKSDLFNYSTTGLQFIQVQYIKTSTVQCINTLRVQKKTVEMKASRQFPYQQLR